MLTLTDQFLTEVFNNNYEDALTATTVSEEQGVGLL